MSRWGRQYQTKCQNAALLLLLNELNTDVGLLHATRAIIRIVPRQMKTLSCSPTPYGKRAMTKPYMDLPLTLLKYVVPVWLIIRGGPVVALLPAIIPCPVI